MHSFINQLLFQQVSFSSIQFPFKQYYFHLSGFHLSNKFFHPSSFHLSNKFFHQSSFWLWFKFSSIYSSQSFRTLPFVSHYFSQDIFRTLLAIYFPQSTFHNIC